MRKIFLILLTMISINLIGQEHSIGIQSGVSFSNVTSNYSTYFRTGFIGGINYNVNLKNNYFFGVDILYSQQGYITKTEIIDRTGHASGVYAIHKLHCNYFSVPLKFGYSYGNKLKYTPRVGIHTSITPKADLICPVFDSDGNIIGEETLTLTNKSKFYLSGLLELGVDFRLTENIGLLSIITYSHSITTFLSKSSKMRLYGLSVSIGCKYIFIKN